MGIYLKNALTPNNCAECQQGFLSIEAECGWGCWNTAGMYNGVFIDPKEVRHPECPMVEVKAPHGRLIDADVLCERLVTEWHTADENGKKIISEVMADVVTPIVVGTPTVIESEVE